MADIAPIVIKLQTSLTPKFTPEDINNLLASLTPVEKEALATHMSTVASAKLDPKTQEQVTTDLVKFLGSKAEGRGESHGCGDSCGYGYVCVVACRVAGD